MDIACGAPEVNTERIVMLALMADCGDDTLALTRFVDTENTLTEDLYWELDSFLQQITMLYVDREVLNLPTYTRWALDMLKNKPLLIVSRGRSKLLGNRAGVSQDIVNRCLKRLACWVRMAHEVAAAEFPDFRVVVSFSIFSLTSGNARGRGAVQGDAAKKFAEHVCRLAKFFNVDENALQEQYNDVYPRAAQLKETSPNMTNWEAWRAAIERLRRSPATAAAHPVDAVLEPLIRWCGWSLATSGLEQNFSQLERVHGTRKDSMTDDRLRDLFTLVTCNFSPEDEQKIYDHARKLWSDHFGRSRKFLASCAARIDRGTKRKRSADNTDNTMTEKAFLDARRGAINAKAKTWAAQQRAGHAQRVVDQSASGWTDAMAEEAHR